MSFKELAETVVSQTQSVMGDDVTYTPSGSDSLTIKGIFDNAFIDIEGVVSLAPVLRVDLSEFDDEPARGDQVTIDSVDYIVSEAPRKDGHGGALLILKKE